MITLLLPSTHCGPDQVFEQHGSSKGSRFVLGMAHQDILSTSHPAWWCCYTVVV